MAQIPITTKNKLDRLLSGTLNQGTASEITTILDGLRQQGYKDEDFKPYLDKLSAGGFTYNSDTQSATPTPGYKPPTTPTAPVETIPGTDIPANSDQGSIEKEAAREKQQGMDVLGQQQGIRQGVLSSLGDVLKNQADAQFNFDLPGIKEQLQGSGLFNSDSALANAVAREKSNLLAPQLSQLQQYGLGATDQYASGLGEILGNQQGLQQGGLQRQFSVNDYNKQAQLAKDIGAQMVPNSPGMFTNMFSGAASGGLAGSAFGPWGAGIGAGVGALTGASKGKGGGGTYLCTHLYKLGLMTKSEVKKVHKKIFSRSFAHPISLACYWVVAPLFILTAKEYDWRSLKPRLCDDILACETSEEAFTKYMGTCLDIFTRVFREVSYGC